MIDEPTIVAHGVEETLDLGRRIGVAVRPGWVIGLVGELGVGKTHLVKGIARGNQRAADAAAEVTSPTFVLVNEYAGRARLYHLDAYRLRCGAELDELGVDEMIDDGVVMIEWADRVAEALPADRLTIHGQSTGETERVWTIRASGPISREWLGAIA